MTCSVVKLIHTGHVCIWPSLVLRSNMIRTGANPNLSFTDYTLSFVDVAHMSYSQEPSPQKAVMAHDWSHRVGEPNLKGIYTRDCWNDTSNEEFLHHFQGWLEHEGVPVPGAESERVNSRALEARRAT